MKEITQYQANDGTIFATPIECAQHEIIVSEVTDAKNVLPPVEVAGENFVQLDPDMVLEYQRALVRVFMRLHPNMVDNHVMWALKAKRPAGHTLIGRYMDDCGPSVLSAAWWRVMCIDQNFRQWSQPYYALRASK